MNPFDIFGGMFGGGMPVDDGSGMCGAPNMVGAVQDAMLAGQIVAGMQQDAMLAGQAIGMQQAAMFGGQPMGYPGQQIGFGYQPPIGRMDYSGYVKYTRPQMLDGLRNYVIMSNQGKVMISREEKLEETPQLLRHACADCGISYLQMLTFNIPEAGVQIPFYFCTACGKLYYYKDFYV